MPRSPVGSLATVTWWNSLAQAVLISATEDGEAGVPAFEPLERLRLRRAAQGSGSCGHCSRALSLARRVWAARRGPGSARSPLCSWRGRANDIWASFQVAGCFQKGALKGWAPLTPHWRTELGFFREDGLAHVPASVARACVYARMKGRLCLVGVRAHGFHPFIYRRNVPTPGVLTGHWEMNGLFEVRALKVFCWNIYR